MSDDYIEYDGTEQSLEQLLVWWGTREPFVHSDACEGEGMHCCEGQTPYPYSCNLGMKATTTKHDDPLPIYFFNYETGEETDMVPGDRIYYLGDGQFDLVRNG